jgi:ATP-binding cassette, subfamily C, bacterial
VRLASPRVRANQRVSSGSRAFLRGLEPRLHRRNVAVLVALMIASALTEGIGLLLLVPILGALDPGSAAGGVAGTMVRLGLPSSLGFPLSLFVVLIVLRAVINHARGLAAMRLELGVVDRLRRRTWSALLHCDWRVLVTMRQSDNASLLVTDIDRVGQGVNQLVAALSTAITLMGIGAAAVLVSPRVAIGGAVCGVIVLVAYRGIRRRAMQLGEQLTEAYASIYQRMSEDLNSLRVIKSFGREAAAEADGAAKFSTVRSAQLAFQRDVGLGQVLLQGGGGAAIAVVIWLAVTRWHAPPATLLPMVALFARALPLLGLLQSAWQNWNHAHPAATAALDLLAVTEAAREPGDSGAAPPSLNREIVVSGVGVRFPGRSAPALEAIELTLPVLRITAITGPSGSGKSTLADVIGGLIGPDEGRVTIDGTVLDPDVRRAWRSRVAYVQQEPVLFNGTVRDNLLWAVPEADEARMHAALAEASAQFVLRLPDGLETLVGDAGRQLSGGERQRIVLARALLREPALLILDEATSALDPDNEAEIAAAVGRLRGHLTILLIAHRGVLADLADQVVRLERGRVVSCDQRSAVDANIG